MSAADTIWARFDWNGESGYVANMSRTIQIAVRPRAANFLQLRKEILKKPLFFALKAVGEEMTCDASVFIVFEEFVAIKLTHVKVFTRSIVQN